MPFLIEVFQNGGALGRICDGRCPIHGAGGLGGTEGKSACAIKVPACAWSEAPKVRAAPMRALVCRFGFFDSGG